MNENSGRHFLEEVDSYIKNNLWTLTCADLDKIYHDFFLNLKEFKGNSNGFTGLSEYLVFRFIYHLLGGSFLPKKATGSNEIYKFESKTDSRINIGQSVPVTVDNKKYYPDIVIYNADVLKAVCQIKIYLTGGRKEVCTEIEKLNVLKIRFPDMRALLIIFRGLSRKGKIMPVLENARTSKSWFQFIVLDGNQELFTTVLIKSLYLNEFVSSTK